MSAELTRIGVLGTGAMGSRFALRLRACGYEVHAWNRTASRVAELAPRGVVVASSPRELAASTDAVVCMLWDSAALREVTAGPDGLLAGLRPGQVVADASTVEPAASRDAAVAAAAVGARLLDIPVSGSLDAAESGQLLIMASGDRAAFEQVRPVLDALARKVTFVGARNGSALVLKLAINLQVALQEIAWGEGLAIAEGYGLSRQDASGVMLDSVIASPMLAYRAPFVLDPPSDVWASVDLLLKDVEYALALVDRPLPAGQHAQRLLQLLHDRGLGGREAAELMTAVADGAQE